MSPHRRHAHAAALVAAACLSLVIASIAGTTVAAADPLEHEAEDALVFGGAGVNANHLGYSGTGFVDGFILDHIGTAGVTFTVEVPAAGEYGLNLRYANGLGADMTLSQVVAGEDRQLTLASATGASWSQWFIHQEIVQLDAGTQEITYRFDADDTGNVNIDAIALTAVGDVSTPGGGATDPGDVPGAGPDTRWDNVTTPLTQHRPPRGGTSYQAELGLAANGANIEVEGSAPNVDMSSERSRLVVETFASDAGTQLVTFRYRSTASRPVRLVLGVDGLPIGALRLDPAASWQEVAVRIALRPGLGTVELRRTGDTIDGEVGIDSIRVQRGTEPSERGAHLGTTVYEAEHGITTGEILAPSRTFHDLAAEASGRQAVTLDSRGERVSWTLIDPADALVVRVSIPDTADGLGQQGVLALYAGNRKIADIPVSSRYSWVYGAYPYGNDPSQGGAQRYFDESRVTFAEQRTGTVLSVRLDASSGSLPYTVDLIETEVRPEPLAAPDGDIDVREHGATADDDTDDTAAFQAAVDAAESAGVGVWVPTGRFTLSDRVRLVGTAIRGAGPWYSVLSGVEGDGGLYALGTGVTIADLMIDGDARRRDDAGSDSGVEGNFGQGSLVQNVWIAHTKTGMWVDAGTDGLAAVGLRVRDTFADGIHLHGGVSDVRVSHASVRNTGDDAMAMWSSGGAVTRSAFVHVTVSSPLLGNGAAIYGGDSNRVTDSVIADTLTAPAGIAVSTRFNPVPFSGTTVVERNDIFRSGGWEPNWNTSFGGIWIFADTSHITTPVVIRDTRIIDSTYEGILVSGSHWVNDLRVEDVVIEGTGAYAVAARVGGDHRFQDVRVSGVVEPADGRNHFWGAFIDGGGNAGLLVEETAACTVTLHATRVLAGRFMATVTVRNTGVETLDLGSLSWHAGSGEVVLHGLGARPAQNGDRVQIDLGGLDLKPDRTRTFVLVGSANATSIAVPETFTLDGLPCVG